MAATRKAAYFKANPGGASVVNTPVAPGANGTWTNFTGVAASQDSACAAAGYMDFDLQDANGVAYGCRMPFFLNT